MFTNAVDFNISKIAELHLVMVGVASTVELRRERVGYFSECSNLCLFPKSVFSESSSNTPKR